MFRTSFLDVTLISTQVREIFHMENFLMMVGYDPEVRFLKRHYFYFEI